MKHTVRPAVKSYCPSEMAILGVCAAVILKNGNVHMNMLQCISNSPQWPCLNTGTLISYCVNYVKNTIYYTHNKHCS